MYIEFVFQTQQKGNLTYMYFSTRLRYLMDCEEITQKNLAAAVHVSPSAISNYVQGTREPDFATLLRLADYFHVSLDTLLGHELPPSSAEGELLRLYRSFAPAQQELLLRQARLLAAYRVSAADPSL